jgi:hypothetical protein
MCVAASGHSDNTKGVAFFKAWRATGLPVLTAVPKFSFSTPRDPPWPEHRSITEMLVSGSRRSISAAFLPMFCARA